MKPPQSTISLKNHTGSTEPILPAKQLESEAAKIREAWKTHNWRENSPPSFDSARLNRHKSLVLNLAIEDYLSACQQSEESISLADHCQRYTGLSEPLERSIVRQLEVQEFLNEHSDSLNLDHLFEWPQSGECFLNFRALEELGRGAMARVYLCEHLQLGNKIVVVKVELGKKVHEPSLLGKLKHSNVIPADWADYDQSLDVSYLCMPFLGRSTLVDLIVVGFQDGLPTSGAVFHNAAMLWLKESDSTVLGVSRTERHFSKPPSYVTSVLRIAIKLANALAFVHAQQIIHGDIKPSNVLLSPDAKPFLLDFNLGVHQNKPGGPAGGTLAYLAPELLRCSFQQSAADPAPTVSTDIYSFGALLYELFTGLPPYKVTSKDVPLQVLASELFDQQKNGCIGLQTLNPEVTPKLAQLINSCLELDPAKRPPSMEVLAEHLTHHLGLTARGKRYARRNPIKTSLIILAAAGILTASISAYWLRPPKADRLYDKAVAARGDGELRNGIEYLDEALAIAPKYYAARLLRAKYYLELDEIPPALGDLQRLVKTADIPEAMAYYAYALNLNEQPDAAVAWYRNTIKNGLVNPAILNNLSVSLLLQSKPQNSAERFALAEPVLLQSLSLEPDSIVIRMNMLLLYQEQININIDNEASGEVALAHAQWLTEKMPNNANVWKSIYAVYLSLSKKGIVDREEVFKALDHYRKCTDNSVVTRFLDPLSADDELRKEAVFSHLL